MADFSFEAEVDRATLPITTTAQRDVIRAAIKTCRTDVNAALTTLGMPSQSQQQVETYLVEFARQTGTDAKNK